jgi:hypothetical protein
MTEFESLRETIARSFAAGEREAALLSVTSYGSQPGDVEPDRVRAAITLLSKGNLARLEQLLMAVRLDYRDVLFWATPAVVSTAMADNVSTSLDNPRRSVEALDRALAPERPRHLELRVGDPESEHACALINGEHGWLLHVDADDTGSWHSENPDYSGPANATLWSA